MSKQIYMSDETYKTFQAALMLTGEEENIVLCRLISEYAHKAFEAAMGNKVAAVSNSANQYVASNSSPCEQKKSFVNWFRGLTRNGKPYNPVTISGYTGRIENACNDPIFAVVPIKNLFAITDLSQFSDIQKQIKACPGYAEFDAKAHNGFTAALKKYEDFLKFQTNGSLIQSPATVTRTYSQSPNVHRWTMEEDEICCKRFLECYVMRQSNMDMVQFLQMLAREVPDVSEGSLRMKIQNVKYLATQAGLKDTSTIKWLSQYSMQCNRAFQKALLELGLR